jgi:hypothetical protein
MKIASPSKQTQWIPQMVLMMTRLKKSSNKRLLIKKLNNNRSPGPDKLNAELL